VDGISEEAMRILTGYDWPGNVRELENVVQRAVVMCHSARIMPEDLDVRIVQREEPLFGEGELVPLKEALKRGERRLILAGLQACGGNRKEAARRLGINRTTLYNKMHEHGLMDA
jgi:DNA-binding NtrC family response regulator